MGHSVPVASIHILEETSTAPPLGNVKSMLAPSDHSRHGWKPCTFSAAVLVPAMLVTASLIIVLGLLQYQNAKQGALFFASTNSGFSTFQDFLYQYFPTVIIVLYGVGWSWIDLDVKRLEPWLQLCQPDGARASSSLLLHYPVDFLPFVPFKAARRKQWTVLSASAIMLFVVWAITPLQNGIFNNNVLRISVAADVVRVKSLLPPQNQSDILGASFMNDAYSTIWLGQKLPGFTTLEYTLAPFELASDITISGGNQTLTSTTSLYTTDLVCHLPAQVSLDSGSVTLDDGAGCVAQEVIFFPDRELSKDFIAYYIGYWDDPNADSSLQLAGCSPKSEHTFLAIWKRASTNPPNFRDDTNATALFCKASYFSQTVNATVSASDKTVLAVTPIDERKPFTEDVFNITRFEYILANGATSDTLRQDVLDMTVLHQDAQLTNMSLVIPVPNMVAFAIGTTPQSPEEYLNPETFATALRNAHRALFAIAAQSVMSATDNEKLQGATSASFEAVSIVPIFAFLSQAFLSLVLICTCFLLFLTSRRPTLLSGDPNNLAQVMRLARHERIRCLFSRYDSADEGKLKKVLEPYQFSLCGDDSTSCPVIDVDAMAVKSPSNSLKKAQLEHDTSNAKVRRQVEPYEYKRWTGIGMSIVLLGLIAILIILRQKANAEGGLVLPSQSSIVQQILLSFIPTSIATLMEPFWVLLSRLACLMVPMEELRRGNASARVSLLSSYTSLPPQLVAWRSLRAGHFLLASLCGLALLANILTVALSGLFFIDNTLHPHVSSVRHMYTANFPPQNGTGESYTLSLYNQNDAFYVAASNFLSRTTLPAWTTPEYFFLPMEFDDVDPTAGEWEVRTTGYGAELRCVELTQTPSDAMYELGLAPNPQLARMKMIYQQEDGSKLQCKPIISLLNSTGQSPNNVTQGEYAAIGGDPFGQTAFEFADALSSLDFDFTNAISDPCNAYIVRGWVRADATPSRPSQSSPTSTTPPIMNKISSSFISCKPQLKTATFNLTLTSTGSILALIQDSPATYTTATNLSFALNQTRNNLNPNTTPVWHNDTLATDFTNNLLKLYTGSTSLLDPSLPPPSPAQAANLTNALFTRLFAIQLSLTASLLTPAVNTTPVIPATHLQSERRVFLSTTLYYLSLAILSLDLLVLMIFYIRLPRPFLPRLPTSIASQIAFFAGSRVIDDVQRAGGDLRELDKLGFRYGYGRFVGRDGWSHVGIERVPFVIGLGEKCGRDGGGSRDRFGGWAGLILRRRKAENVRTGQHENLDGKSRLV